MGAATIQEQKLELIQWLSIVEDEAILAKVAELKEQSSADWWDDISDAERRSITKGIEDADAGRLRPHSEAKAIYEERL